MRNQHTNKERLSPWILKPVGGDGNMDIQLHQQSDHDETQSEGPPGYHRYQKSPGPVHIPGHSGFMGYGDLWGFIPLSEVTSL